MNASAEGTTLDTIIETGVVRKDGGQRMYEIYTRRVVDNEAFRRTYKMLRDIGKAMGMDTSTQSVISRMAPTPTREGAADDGYLIRAVEPAWREIALLCAGNPDIFYAFTPEKFEELIAASYDTAEYTVTLTWRRGDLDRDTCHRKSENARGGDQLRSDSSTRRTIQARPKTTGGSSNAAAPCPRAPA